MNKLLLSNTHTHLQKRERRLYRLLFIFLFFLIAFIPTKSGATHVAGGVLTYEWLGGSNYRITVTLYWDCSAALLPPNSMNVNIESNSCWAASTINAALTNPGGTEIGYSCPSSTYCNGGTNPGYKKYIYQVDVTMLLNCTDIVMWYEPPGSSGQSLGRSSAITTLNSPGSTGLYTETTLNNLNYPDNSTISFNNDPILFVCAGQQATFNLGADNFDGDSLVYDLVTAKTYDSFWGIVSNVSYVSPLSGTNPLFPGAGAISINSTTGQVTINTSVLQVAVIAIRIREYRNGVLVSTTIVDVQVVVQNCSNNYPAVTGINGFADFVDTVCAGSTVNFSVNSSDPDGQTLTMSWNNGIPSPASFSSSGSPSPTGNFSWTTSASDARPQPYTFTVTVQDNSCPINGFQTQSYSIYVLSAASININPASPSVCNGSSTVLTATGATTYSWSPSTGLSNPNVANPTATPSVTTTYTVTGSIGGGCTSTKTVTVTVGNTPAAAASPSVSVCNGQSTSLSASGGGTYVWSPASGLSNPNISNPTATPSVTTTYSVTVTNGGCTATATTTVTVNAVPPPPTITKSAGGDTLFCSTNAAYASYQWYKNTVILNGETNYYLVIGTDTADFTVVVKSSAGCTNTASYSNRLLPVEFLSFNAIYNGRTVDLDWSTTSEVNNDYFLIEKTKDGTAFSTIGKVKGSGTSNLLNRYSFIDDNPWPGTSAYRLKQTDFDGQFQYSRMAAVVVSSSGKLNILALNKQTAESILYYFIYTDGKPITIEIKDMLGKVVLKRTAAEISGTIDFSSFARGSYIFSVSDDSNSISRKLIH